VKELASIPEGEDVRLVVLPEKEPWWRAFFGEEKRIEVEPAAAAIAGLSAALGSLRPMAIAALLSGEPALISPMAMAIENP
jgi:hypothetical protein